MTGDDPIPIDLVFVIDTTGSMSDDIDAVKDSATEIIQKLEDGNPGFRIAIVTYKDAGDVYVTKTQLAFTSNSEDAIAAIQSITVDGGGDFPEAVLAALDHAILNQQALGTWRGGDIPKQIILMGDAPPHDPDLATGATLASVSQHALDGGVIIGGGSSSSAIAAAEASAPLPVNIFPIVIGGDTSAISSFQAIADANRGKLFTAATADDVVDALLDAIDEVGGDGDPPTDLDLLSDSDTGRLNDDDFTGDATPTIRASAEPGSEVKFFVDGVEVATAAELEDEPGVFEVTLPAGSLVIGDNTITATADDSDPSEPLVLHLGTQQRVTLNRRNRSVTLTQADDTDVTVRVNEYTSATVDLLKSDTQAELIAIQASELRSDAASLVVEGTGGQADVPFLRTTTSNFGGLTFSNVILGDIVTRRHLGSIGFRGDTNVIEGTLTINGDLKNLLGRNASLTGGVWVRGDVRKIDLGETTDTSWIDVGRNLERIAFFADSQADLKARSLGTLVAYADLTGSILVKTQVELLDLRGDSDLEVTASRIRQIRNAGIMDGEYHVSLIDRIRSRGTVIAKFDPKTKILNWS